MPRPQPKSVGPGRAKPRHLWILFQAVLIVPVLALGTYFIQQPSPPVELETAAFGMNTKGALLNLDFESPLPAPLTSAAGKAAWSTPSASLTSTGVFPANSLVEGGNERNRFLVRKFSKGSYNTSDKKFRNTAILRWTLAETHPELYLAYRVRTSYGFELGKGGKLPGLCGGNCPTGGQSPRDGTGAKGWSSRIMWGAGGGFSEYLYWAEQPGEYGKTFSLRKNGRGPSFNDGGWHIVQQYVRMNDPGRSNGHLRVSIDGIVYLARSDLRFRDDNSFGIDTFLFSNFFGGNDESWASPAEQRIYFDDFVVSRQRIVTER